MDSLPKPKVEVVITSAGVEAVRLYGTAWSDSEAAVTLFTRVVPFLRQIHAFLRPAEGNAKPS